jgi:hypothetical protein
VMHPLNALWPNMARNPLRETPPARRRPRCRRTSIALLMAFTACSSPWGRGSRERFAVRWTRAYAASCLPACRRRPRVPSPSHRSARPPPVRQAPGRTGDTAEKMALFFLFALQCVHNFAVAVCAHFLADRSAVCRFPVGTTGGFPADFSPRTALLDRKIASRRLQADVSV